jgi:hypothetical protein
MSKMDQLRALREAQPSSRGGRQSGPVGGLRKDARPAPPTALVVGNGVAGVATGSREHKRGRPLNKDKAATLTAQKPWEAEGMSRTTWYRRQAEELK